MSKTIGILCVLSCFLLLVGCQVQTEETVLLKQGVVENIRVSTLPENYECFFIGTNTKPIVTYLENLTLQSDFEEDPDEYDGMTLVITVTYEDGGVVTLYHFGNRFIRSEGGPWFKMSYEEASQLERLLKNRDMDVLREWQD